MDQADTASNTDCLATNNIMVFNLQAQPPGGMAGDNGTPHIFGLMPWSGAGQGISQSGPEVCQLPDSRYNAKPDFPMEADMMEQDGSPAGWMQPQGNKVRKHIHDKHNNVDQEPRMFLPRCTYGRRGADWRDQVVSPGSSFRRETSSMDAASLHVQDSKDAPTSLSLDTALDSPSPHKQSFSTYREHSPQYSLPVPSQSVFPERERVPPYAHHADASFTSQDMAAPQSPAQLSKKRMKLTKMTAKHADEENKTVALSRPRDFYSVELLGDAHVFSCLHCNYRRTAVKGNFSAQAAIIFHVRRQHMDKRTFWRCSLCEFRGLKHSRVGRHNKRAHQGKATLIRECGIVKDLRRK